MRAKYMVDYTPGPVALQGARALAELIESPRRILDPSAGAGVFGQVFRQVWPEAKTVGVEPKREEAWFLSCNYDEYLIDEFEGAEGALYRHDFDLVMTNPPFHSWEAFIPTALSLVRQGGLVCFLGLTSWGSRSTSGAELFEHYTPIAQFRISGAVSYRPKGSDMRDYCWWVFRRQASSVVDAKCWVALNLPRLPSSDRKWGNTRPGRVYGEKFQTGLEGDPVSQLGSRHLPCGVFA